MRWKRDEPSEGFFCSLQEEKFPRAASATLLKLREAHPHRQSQCITIVDRHFQSDGQLPIRLLVAKLVRSLTPDQRGKVFLCSLQEEKFPRAASATLLKLRVAHPHRQSQCITIVDRHFESDGQLQKRRMHFFRRNQELLPRTVGLLKIGRNNRVGI